MPYCCVPFCKTNGKNCKTLGASFHEFPSNLEVKHRWVQNIRRMDFTPSDNLHFITSNYVEGRKRRCLKNGAVPSVFPSYPKYLQAAAAKTAKTRPPPKIRQPLAKKSRKVTSKEATDSVKVQSTKVDRCLPSTLEPPSSLIDPGQPELPETSQDTSKSRPTTPPSCCSPKLKKKPGRPPLSVTPESLKRTIRLCQWKIRSLTKQVQARNSIISTLKTELNNYRGERITSVKEIAAEAEYGSGNAAFLFDQLKAFNAQKPRWSEMTVQNCVLWQLKSPRGYEFARKSKLLKLPSIATLQKYAEEAIAEPDIITLVTGEADVTTLVDGEDDIATLLGEDCY